MTTPGNDFNRLLVILNYLAVITIAVVLVLSAAGTVTLH